MQVNRTSRRLDDSRYYAQFLTIPFSSKIAVTARINIHRKFLEIIAPTERTKILDFGASEIETKEANILEKLYPWKDNVTCVGTGDGDQIRRFYPEVRYLSIRPRQPLPLTDSTFDVAVCHAVLEHVGTDADRAFVVTELARVARRLFLSIPNRWFPIEHHTGIPLLHYSPSLFRRLLRSTRHGVWCDPAQLEFISRRSFRCFWPSHLKARSAWAGINLGPLSSNIIIWT